jgi:hypothetical protein
MNQIKILAAIFVLFTVLLTPWRSSLSQDDAVYARFAMELTHDFAKVHPLNVGGIWTQALLGAQVLKIVPHTDPILLLTTTTWLSFCVFIFVVGWFTRFPAFTLASFFLFPVWVQYGASFLPDVYSAVLVFILWWLYFSIESKTLNIAATYKNGWRILGIVLASVLAGIQYQVYLALPFAWGLAGIWKKRPRDAWPSYLLMGSAFLGLVVYSTLPKSVLQVDGVYWILQGFLKDVGFNSYRFVFLALQLTLALGLYFIPLLPLEKETLKKAPIMFLLQLIVAIVLLFVSPEVLSAGVFFTGYLPPVIGALLISTGVWGLFGVWIEYQRGMDKRLFWGLVLGTVIVISFHSLRVVQDIRYAIVLSVPFLLLLSRRKSLASGPLVVRLGQKIFYLVPIFLVSLLTNLYNLETTEARWKLARELEERQVDPFQISAGYGRDIFVFEPACIQSALRKIVFQKKPSDPLTRNSIYYERVVTKVPRLFEDEATPHYLIKPKMVFGKEITLIKNLRQGQNSEPIKVLNYTVLGLPNQVAVIDTGVNIAPWCFQ